MAGFVIPQDITFKSTNVPEDTLNEWVSGGTYSLDDIVKVSIDEKKYKCAYATTTASTIAPNLDTNNWLPAPLNRVAMISPTYGSQTVNPESIKVVFSATNIDTISLLNVEAKQVDIRLKHNKVSIEVLGTGDGVLATFSGTTNVLPFEGFVEIWVNGVKEAEDLNGDGVLEDVTGNYTLSSGTVDYATKAVSVTFSSAVTSTHTVELRYNAKIFSVSKNMVYDDLSNFGDYLYSEQELRDATTAKLTTAELDLVVASMSSQELLNSFTASPPIYYDVDVYIDILNPGTDAKCGFVLVGRKKSSGVTMYNGKIGIYTTGTRDRNAWNDVEFVPGSVFNTMDIPVIIDDVNYDLVKTRFEKLINKPILLLGDDSDAPLHQSMNMYGFYYQLELPITPTKTIYNLRMESLL